MTFFKKILYSYYKNTLKKDVLKNRIPQHIGIILDGNRRYARKCGFCDLNMGHEEGADKLYEVLSWCLELNIKIVTVWAFSTDNFKRKAEEVESLFGIIKSHLEYYIDSKFINDNGIKVSIIGRRDLIPEDLASVIEKLESKTMDYSRLKLFIAVGYGGRQEICDAISRLVSDNIPALNEALSCGQSLPDPGCLSDIVNVESISRYLYSKDSPDPDLIIRTSGEIRLSGFMLWQSAYSEFYFCDAYWPEFREIDFLRAIRSFQSRQIRSGR